MSLTFQETPQTRRKPHGRKGREPRDPESVPARSLRKSWLSTTPTGPSEKLRAEHSRPPVPPGTRTQACSPQPRRPAWTLRTASGGTCVRTAAAASPTRPCWSATGGCTPGSGPSPAPSAACALRGSSRWRRTSGSTAPALGGGGAGGLASGLCLALRCGVTGTHLCCSDTTQTSLRSAGEPLAQAGVEPELDCLSPAGGSRGRGLGTEIHPLGFPQGSLKFQNL